MTFYARDYCQALSADLPTVADNATDGFLDYLLSRTAAQSTVCRVTRAPRV